MANQTRYIFYVLGSGLSVAVSMVLTEIVLRHFAVEAILVIALGHLVGGGVLILVSVKNYANIRRAWQLWDWGRLLAAALCTYVLAYVLNIYAISFTGSTKAALLGQLETVFVVILAIIFLGETLSARRWLAGGLALGGVLLINLDPQAWQLTFGLGELLGVLAPLGFATGVIILKPVLDRVDARWVTGLALLLGAFFLAPFVLFSGALAKLAWQPLLLIAALGLIEAAAWLLFNISLKHIGASRSSIIFLSYAFFTLMLQVTLTHINPLLNLQTPASLLAALLGGMLVAAGIIILETDPRPARL